MARSRWLYSDLIFSWHFTLPPSISSPPEAEMNRNFEFFFLHVTAGSSSEPLRRADCISADIPALHWRMETHQWLNPNRPTTLSHLGPYRQNNMCTPIIRQGINHYRCAADSKSSGCQWVGVGWRGGVAWVERVERVGGTGPRGKDTVHHLIAHVRESTRLANVNRSCRRYLLGPPRERGGLGGGGGPSNVTPRQICIEEQSQRYFLGTSNWNSWNDY